MNFGVFMPCVSGSVTVQSRGMNHREAVLRLFTLYCGAAGRSPARVSTLIWNHGARYRQIVAGADLRTRNFERALGWFSGHWPPELPWPAGIFRPLAEKENAAAPTREERALGEAMTLGPDGSLRSPAALCRALCIRRGVYDYVVQRYADGGDRSEALPQRDTWSRRLLDYLVASGDARFALRRARLEKAVEVARRHLGTPSPESRPAGKRSDAV